MPQNMCSPRQPQHATKHVFAMQKLVQATKRNMSILKGKPKRSKLFTLSGRRTRRRPVQWVLPRHQRRCVIQVHQPELIFLRASTGTDRVFSLKVNAASRTASSIAAEMLFLRELDCLLRLASFACGTERSSRCHRGPHTPKNLEPSTLLPLWIRVCWQACCCDSS